MRRWRGYREGGPRGHGTPAGVSVPREHGGGRHG